MARNHCGTTAQRFLVRFHVWLLRYRKRAVANGRSNEHGSAQTELVPFGVEPVTQQRELPDKRLAGGLPVVARKEQRLPNQIICLLGVGERDRKSRQQRCGGHHRLANGTVRIGILLPCRN